MDEVVARQAIADHFGVPVALVVDEADLRDLGADSLDIIELSVALEQQFDVRIPDDEGEGNAEMVGNGLTGNNFVHLCLFAAAQQR